MSGSPTQAREPARTVVIVAGGTSPGPPVRALPEPATVIAADSGLGLARSLGLDVDLLVGDLDSVTAGDLASARREGVPVERHPVDKDRTDLAIALDAARERGATHVTVLGGDAGRLDHLLAGVLLLGAEEYRGMEVTALLGRAVVTVVRRSASLRGRAGELVSLVPAHGPVHGVTTRGLRFALHGETLAPGSSRGVSNEFLDVDAHVHVQAGALLAVQPAAGDPNPRSGDQ